MVVVTGGVKSNIARTQRTLREDSLYRDIEPEFTARITHSQSIGQDNVVYARGVVAEALREKGRKKWVWKGNKTWLVWFVKTFIGGWGFDLVLPRMFGLDKLMRILRARKR